jgi:hypothetical protein
MKASITLFLAVLSIFVFADTIVVDKSINKLIPTTSQDRVNNSTMSDSEAYKLLYLNEKNSNDKMISIIEWVIGISVTFLIAIFGGQIFFNWKINKKEIDYIKKDIEERIGELKAILIKDQAQINKEQTLQINTTIDKIEKDLLQKLDGQFDKKSKLIDVYNDVNKREIEFLERKISNEIKQLNIEVEKNSGDLWVLKGVDSNALSSFVRTAIMKLEMKSDVKYILDEVIQLLEKIDEISVYDDERLKELVEKLDAINSEKKKKIEKLYSSKPVYKFIDRPNQNPFGFPGFSKEYVKNIPGIATTK